MLVDVGGTGVRVLVGVAVAGAVAVAVGVLTMAVGVDVGGGGAAFKDHTAKSWAMYGPVYQSSAANEIVALVLPCGMGTK